MTGSRLTLVLLLAVACRNKDVATDDSPVVESPPADDSPADDSPADDSPADDSDSPAPTDDDGDGYTAEEDCDDTNAGVHPGATETCDGVDQNCDGDIDEDAVDRSTWYADGDRDGYGTDATTTLACTQPTGYAAEGGDCNDNNTDFHPNADESDCTDPNDYNCDGSVGYADGDRDGYAACEDCDDGARAVNPSASELCDGIDNNCDSLIDGADAVGQSTWYPDGDSDGYGANSGSVSACDQPTGYVSDHTDCDDNAASTNPGASEVCDGDDNDCNRVVDDNATDATTWYLDYDGDGYGSTSYSLTECDQPNGYVSDNTDCDDRESTTNPGASEVCDGADNNCDSTVDNTRQVYGDAALCAATDCEDLVTRRPNASDGAYWIDPDGAGAFEAYCDTTTDGGGWTLVAKLTNQDSRHWTTAKSDWTSTTAYGTTDDLSTGADAKSEAWGRLQADELLLTDDTNVGNYILTTDNCLRNYTPADYFTLALASFPNTAVSSDYFDTCTISYGSVPGWAAEPDWASNDITSTNLSFDNGYLVIGRTDSTDTAGVVSFYDTTYYEADVGLGALESAAFENTGYSQDIGGPTSCSYSDSQCATEYPETVYFWVR